MENMKALSPYPASGRPVAVPRFRGKLIAAIQGQLVSRRLMACVTCLKSCKEGRTATTTGKEGEEA